MPQAPELAPSLAPSTSGVAGPSLDVPVDAFGGAVGHALQGLGTAVEGASDKIWARAMDMQNLQNETEVDKADAEYMEKAGLIHAQFGAKQGQEQADAFPKYIQDLKTLREGIRDKMSNPMTSKMFDKTSLSTMGRTIFNGAGMAATATRSAAIDAVQSRMKTVMDHAANTDDPAAQEADRKTLQGLNYHYHELKGTPGSVSDDEHSINSSLDANNIKYIGKTDPWKAEELLQQKKSSLSQQDYDSADKFVTSQRRSIGSVNTANEIWTQSVGDGTKPEVSEDAMIELGKKKAAEDAPDDPIYAQHVEAAIHAKYTREKQAQRQFTWDAKQVIAKAIQDGAVNIQQLRADPNVAPVINGMSPTEQNAIPGQINRYIKARDYYDNQRSMTTLQGLKNNDVLQFLDTDATAPEWKLSQAQIRTVNGWKAELQKNQNQDPQVNRAMGWLRGSIGSQLQALGIYHRSSAANTDNTNDYDHFTGALSEALQAWGDAHGKPAEPKDVTETIAPQLLKTHSVPGMLWGTNTSDPMYKDTLNTKQFKEFAKAHTADALDRGEPAPTPAETERLYYRGLAQTLYGKKKSSP
jgi:hypothetical protein